MLSGMTNVADFLVSTLLGLYAFIFIFRFFLQVVKANFYNPISQFVVRFTNPLVMIFRKVIPGYFNLDWSCLVAAYFIFLVQNIILLFLKTYTFEFSYINLVLPFFNIISNIINMYIYLILIRAIFSWFANTSYNPLIELINVVTEPLLSRSRNAFGGARSGIDFSPMIVMITLFCIQIFMESFLQQIL